MPRIAEGRAAAEPSSPRQVARHRRVLRAAADLAADNGLERVQMHEVAKNAGVAIGTLYRYFPSKTHLFTAVMAQQVERLSETVPSPTPGTRPEDAVSELLVDASRQLLRRPLLAVAMMQSVNAAHAGTISEASRIDSSFSDLILQTLGIDDPTDRDITLVRLLVQCWYGVLTSSLNERMSLSQAEHDIHAACQLLLAPRSNAGTGSVPAS